MTPKKEMLFWDFHEFRSFIDTVDNNLWRTFFSTLYFMGLRIGECLALSDADVDLEKKIFKVTKSLTRKTIDGTPYKITPPKNMKSVRTISIPDALVEIIYLYLAYKKAATIPSDFLFGGLTPIPETTYQRCFAFYCQKANVKKIRIHDLRHSHASLLINNGANILLVSKRLGHSGTTETLKTYGHLFPETEVNVVHNINFLVGTSLGTKN